VVRIVFGPSVLVLLIALLKLLLKLLVTYNELYEYIDASVFSPGHKAA